MKKGKLLAVVLTVASLFLFLFLPALKAELMGLTSTANGLEVMKDGEFVIMVLITLILMVGAIVCALTKKLALVASILLVVASVFCFLTKTFFVSANNLSAVAEMYKLGIGAIISGVLCAISAVLVFISNKN